METRSSSSDASSQLPDLSAEKQGSNMVLPESSSWVVIEGQKPGKIEAPVVRDSISSPKMEKSPSPSKVLASEQPTAVKQAWVNSKKTEELAVENSSVAGSVVRDTAGTDPPPVSTAGDSGGGNLMVEDIEVNSVPTPTKETKSQTPNEVFSTPEAGKVSMKLNIY